MKHAKLIRYFILVLFVAVMTLCAELTGDKEYIFPEIGALCIGLFVVDKQVWRVCKWQIPVLFTIAALVGVCVVRYLPWSLPLQMELGFLAVVVLISLFDVSIPPVISACMLPILIGTSSWLYVLVVLVSSLLLILGQYVLERMHCRQVFPAPQPSAQSPFISKTIWHWLALMLILAPILVCSSWLGVKFVCVPPLIVTLVEFSNAKSGFRKRPVFTWALIVLAAIIGTFTEVVMHGCWSVPQTICAALAVSLVLLVFDRCGKYFAPAMAISLVPMILPSSAQPWFPLFVAVGAAYFILMAELCFRSARTPNERK